MPPTDPQTAFVPGDYGYDRRGDGCSCSWASRNHGDVCPEHGMPAKRQSIIDPQIAEQVAKEVIDRLIKEFHEHPTRGAWILGRLLEIKNGIGAAVARADTAERKLAEAKQVIKDYGDQIIARRKLDEDAAACKGDEMAYAVLTPNGEYDHIVFAEKQDAESQVADMIDADTPADEVPSVIPLYAISNRLAEAERECEHLNNVISTLRSRP